MLNKIIILQALFFFFVLSSTAQEIPKLMEMEHEMTEVWEPEVKVITPGDKYGDAPSDAIVLFDGTNLDEWVNENDSLPQWPVKKGVVTVVKRGKGIKGPALIKTKRKFGSVQLHIEWRTPAKVHGESQKRGNSGVIFCDGQYEVQILDSYNNRTYKNGQAASIYKQYAPLVNASKGPGEWQTFDIIFKAPHFKEDGSYLVPPVFTVLHNGVLVQHAVKLRGPCVFIGMPEYQIKKHGKGSIILQNHGKPVSYRNIWVRELTL
ncbi:3-keto-disaccharide hydrolase [Labilibacter marinus]|uniref:3-keto-disaccharide hydrolase n=1 Tax=Labilibacter marinus TaxID=1477105 RepID=UPI0008300ADF|nr:DUF1080 domain-containing protein [Labilibacter marinus]